MTGDRVTGSWPATGDAGAALAAYRRELRRRRMLIGLLALATLAAAALDVVVGPSALGVERVVTLLVDPSTATAAEHVILWDVRLPTAVLALLVGAALALAGTEMQTVLGNPMAEPFTLGVSMSAALGAALAIVLDIHIPGVPAGWVVSANAFVFALFSLLLLQSLTRLRGTEPQTLILFGIAISFTASALLSLVQFLASEDALQQLVFWTMGSLARAGWSGNAGIAVVLLVAALFAARASADLTALRLGDDRARTFGVDVGRLRLGALIRTSLLAASAVALVGTIGFVGLVGPHVARMLVGEDHRHLLPASALAGALVMSLASLASKSISPGELLPVGVLTSLIGLPWFVALILRRSGS